MTLNLMPTASAELRAPSTARATEWRRSHFIWLVALAALQTLLRAERPMGQDAYWSARYGLDVIHSGTLARVDSYSWTAPGQKWIPSSWAWNVVLGGTYDLLGLAGFWVLGLAISVATALVVGVLARRVGARPLATLAVYSAVGLLALEVMPRAQMVSNLAAVAIPLLTVRALKHSGRRAAVAAIQLCLLQAVWMNVHSVALLGPVLLVATGSAMLLSHAVTFRSALPRLAILAAAACGACLATPYGILPITHVAQVRNASVGLITEWDSAGFGGPTQLVALVAAITGIWLAQRAWRAGRQDSAACLLVLALATASAIRFLPMLAVLAAPDLALAIGQLRIRARFMRLVIGCVTTVLVLMTGLAWRDLTSLEPLVSPQLVADLPSGCRLLNDDLVGDAVILMRPDVLVSVDGRNDVYGRARIERVLHEFDSRPGTQSMLTSEHVTCVLGPSSSALIKELQRAPGWSTRAKDGLRTLLVKDAAT